MLSKGTKLDPRSLTASELAPTISLEVGKRIRATPFGENYQGSQGSNKLLLTTFEPDLVVEPEARERLSQSLAAASAIRHASILSTFGSIDVSGTLVAVRAHPNCPPLRNFIDRRNAREKEISEATALGIIIEVAHALCALHPNDCHGFVNSETVFLSKTGKVLLGGLGEMPVLRAGATLRSAYASGLLPMPPPELRGNSPKPSPASDIFFLGSLFVEMITGKCITAAGDDMRSLQGRVAPALREIFVSCCAPRASARPSDAFEFLDQLAKFQKGSSALPTTSEQAGVPAAAIQDPPSADAFMNLGALASLDGASDSALRTAPAAAGPPTASSSPAIGLGALLLDGQVGDGVGGDLEGIALGDERGSISLSSLDEGPSLSLASPDGDPALPGVGVSLDMLDADARLVVVVNGIDEGPYDLDTIRSKIRAGTITPETLVGEISATPSPAGSHPATSSMFTVESDGSVALVATDMGGPAGALPIPDMSPSPTAGAMGSGPIGLDLSNSPAMPGPAAATATAHAANAATPNDAPLSPDFVPTPSPTHRRRTSGKHSSAGTVGWVLVTLMLFAITAWVMWQRQGSGG